MARTLRDAALETRAARARLKARGKPYYRLLEEGVHLGYRKPKGRRGSPAAAGKWVLRTYRGGQSYKVETVANADDFSDPDGEFVLSFAEAQARAREQMAARAHAAVGRGPYTVSNAISDYLGWIEATRKTPYESRRRAQAYIEPQLGSMECSALTAEIVRKWHADMAKEGPLLRTKAGEQQKRGKVSGDPEWVRQRRASANRVLTILKAALNHAWREKKIRSDAEWRRVKPFSNVEAARVRYLTVAEAQRLINASDPEFRPLVQAALHTGARYGELARLQVRDFNRDAGTISIRQSKSGKSRHVVLTEEGSALFEQLTAGREGGELCMPRATGGAWRASHQNRPMAKACKAGNVERMGFHGLRHTWASLAVMNGVPLMVVAKNLGHSDTRMVEHHYGHLAPSYVTEAIRAGAPRFGVKPDGNIASLDAHR